MPQCFLKLIQDQGLIDGTVTHHNPISAANTMGERANSVPDMANVTPIPSTAAGITKEAKR